jgi:GTP-binding protein
MILFIDVVDITIKSGNGGDGAVSFHREKYIAKGGPDGGDGGKGGDIIFIADDATRTLLDFRYTKKFLAGNGENGSSARKSGKKGADKIIRVPTGTRISLADTGKIVADMAEHGKSVTVLRGGRGGRGNARFATPTRQAPRFAQPGQVTPAYTLRLELLSIADVGLVGFPNVGKSTLLSVVSAARPKIADYHFTTLSPNLGVVTHDGYSFVMADIPGIIENAHEGAGLGFDFLRHISRTRMLIHVLDISGIEGRDPVDDYQKINHELHSYQPELSERPQLIAANKIDLPGSEKNLRRLQEFVGPSVRIFPISAPLQQGVSPLLLAVVEILKRLPLADPVLPEVPELSSALEGTFTVTKLAEIFIVEGPVVDRILKAADPDDRFSMDHFQTRLQSSGIIDALRDAGAKDGDTVHMGDMEFDFIE